jgi:hypothetical protein
MLEEGTQDAEAMAMSRYAYVNRAVCHMIGFMNRALLPYDRPLGGFFFAHLVRLLRHSQ